MEVVVARVFSKKNNCGEFELSVTEDVVTKNSPVPSNKCTSIEFINQGTNVILINGARKVLPNCSTTYYGEKGCVWITDFKILEIL